MGRAITFSPESLEDLESIVRFIARDNPERAESFGYELITTTDVLVDFPESGRIVPEFSDPEIRELIHGNYRIVYRVVASDQRIEILRYWHAARGEPEV